jgi:RNA-directed DNA polymerase
MIIKKFLKAGIMNEIKENPIGTPQGGVLSPLLANIYLDGFDQWVFRQWEGKITNHDYSWGNKYRALRGTGLQPAYLVRYADDWVLITNSREHAIAWKRRINSFLQDKLKLKLSEEKTVITNVRKKNIKFLGYEYKLTKGKSRTGYIPKTMPNRDRVKRKVQSILIHIQRLSKSNTFEIIHNINRINSMIRGLINYYEPTTLVYVILSKYSYTLNWAGIWALKRFGVDWLQASKVNNLTSVHSDYETKIPTIMVDELKIGITNIGFCKFRKVIQKNQEETPYTQTGRKYISSARIENP